MKLLDRYNRVNLVTTITVMLITGIIYYGAITLILTNQLDKDLTVEENEIFEYVEMNHQLPQVFESADQQISFIPAAPGSVMREFINTDYHKPKDKNHKPENRHRRSEEYESGRGLISSVTVGSKFYRILIVESKVETEDLIKIIFAITGSVILLLLLVLSITNRLIFSRLWKPFHTLLKELQLFNLADNKDIPLSHTNTDEFRELNKEVVAMSLRVKNDYKSLKTFTENASHELLTPIAVINSKLDTLIQTDNFSPKQSKLLNDLYTAVSRLTRLNHSLLLLVKLENGQLQDTQPINFSTLITEMLTQFEEIFNDKDLTVTHSLSDKELNASAYLVDILLNNLLSNAVRHNVKHGKIDITLTEERLVIKNTGENKSLELEKIFNRFHKSSSSEGTGLGLTISKEICANFNCSLRYQFEAPYHLFIVEFNGLR